MDRLLKRIQRVCPAVFYSRDFFLLHDNAPAHKAASFCQFLTQKMLQSFITPPPHSPDLYPPDYFLFPKLKMKLKGLLFADVAEIQEAVADELKKVQKEEFSNFRQLFRNSTTAQTPVYMQMELILNKKGMCFPHVSSILKKISPKFWTALCRA
jgi:hypothetical protein